MLEGESPCDGCAAGCCRAFAVPLTGFDIVRIMRRQGLGFWDFVARWEDAGGSISRGVAPHFHFADLPDVPFVIGLLHHESRAFPGATRCRFLQEREPTAEAPDGTGRCGMYADRPLACRIFPARIGPDGELGIAPVDEYGREERHEAYRLCPRSWTLDDLNAEEALRDLRTAAREMQHFKLAAELWNRRPLPWTAFPEFIRLVYAEEMLRGLAG